MSITHNFFAVSPKYLEDLVSNELQLSGATELKETPGGVFFSSSFRTAYKACLECRVATRILYILDQFPARSTEELYENALKIPWDEHLEPGGTFAVDCTLSRSCLTHSHYAALKLKDAIADFFSSKYHKRPGVSLVNPDVRFNLFVREDTAVIRIDLSGTSLHRRGYREEGGRAPLKENVAAAVLLRAGWQMLCKAGYAFADPMCGSGTFPVEACLIALDLPPGVFREHSGIPGWKGHAPAEYREVKEEAAEKLARARNTLNPRTIAPILGFDADKKAIASCQAVLRKLGLEKFIHFERRELAQVQRPETAAYEQGLITVNPPYGIRLGESDAEVQALYQSLGGIFTERFKGWKACVLTGQEELAHAIGLKVEKVNRIYNGDLNCVLAHFDLNESNIQKTAGFGKAMASRQPAVEELSPQIIMFMNRIKKNLKLLKKWAARESITCYRVYDSDLPDYAVAIDLYEGRNVMLQEYAPPKEIEPAKAEQRLADIQMVLPGLFGLEPAAIHFRQRKRQKGKTQYTRLASTPDYVKVHEGGLQFYVNFSNYLDTGLFLDHRHTRHLIRDLARNRTFLNLFAYTGTATAYAAAGKAISTVSVDASRTYLDWARRNMALNGFATERHEYIKEDCRTWLKSHNRKFGLIFCDPPTFSNSKDLDEDLDIARDHVELIRLIMRHLEKTGTLFFSTHARRFKMDEAALAEFVLENITATTIPQDFQRNKRIHQCYTIRWK